MKTLLLLRHGQAEKQTPGGDRERALTARGAHDSAMSARWLLAAAGRPDAICSSYARRACETAAIVADLIDSTAPVRPNPGMYAADARALLDMVRRLPDAEACVLLVGHNPGFEELAGLLAAPGSPTVELPTAGVAYLTFAVERWREVRPATGRLQGIYRPKDTAEL